MQEEFCIAEAKRSTLLRDQESMSRLDVGRCLAQERAIAKVDIVDVTMLAANPELCKWRKKDNATLMDISLGL